MKKFEDVKNDSLQSSRRHFLKTAAFLGVGAAMTTALPVLANAQTKSSVKQVSNEPLITKKRMLGSGNSAMEVAAIGFGCMGMNYHRGYHPDKKAMTALAHKAVDLGVTLFDTAETYGPFTNEELTGDVLAPYKGKIAVTTKFGFNYDGNVVNGLNSRPERIRKVAEESLKRLKIDVIELFYQHRFDPQVPIEDVAGTVQDLIKEGKVKHFGLCEVGAETIRKAHAVQRVTAIQSEYHLMWREPEKEVFPVLEELGIGFVPYSPINRGFLGGTINEYTKFDSGNDNRDILPRFTPEAIRANTAIIEELNKFGHERGMTTSQVALAWLLAKKSWIVPIPGTTKLSHLEENLRAADFSLTPKDVDYIENVVSKIKIVGDRYPAVLQNQVGK